MFDPARLKVDIFEGAIELSYENISFPRKMRFRRYLFFTLIYIGYNEVGDQITCVDLDLKDMFRR